MARIIDFENFSQTPPTSSEESEPDKYQNIADEYEASQTRPRNKGGGTKKFNPQNASSKTAHASNRERLKGERAVNAEQRISDQLKLFPVENLPQKTLEKINDYADWVDAYIRTGAVELNPDRNDSPDVKYKNIKKSQGAGGQRVNKSATAVLCTHLLTGAFALGNSESEAIKNEKVAFSLLRRRLEDHLEDWKLVLNDVQDEEERKAKIKETTTEAIKNIKPKKGKK